MSFSLEGPRLASISVFSSCLWFFVLRPPEPLRPLNLQVRRTDSGAEQLKRGHTRLQVLDEDQQPEVPRFSNYTRHSFNLFAFIIQHLFTSSLDSAMSSNSEPLEIKFFEGAPLVWCDFRESFDAAVRFKLRITPCTAFGALAALAVI